MKSRRRKAGREPIVPSPHRCDATRRVADTCRMLGELAAGGSQMVLIGKVLALLDPGQQHVPAPHPLADPLTGAMPVDPAAYQEGASP